MFQEVGFKLALHVRTRCFRAKLHVLRLTHRHPYSIHHKQAQYRVELSSVVEPKEQKSERDKRREKRDVDPRQRVAYLSRS